MQMPDTQPTATPPSAFAAFIGSLSNQMGVPLDPEPGVVQLNFNGVQFMLAHDPEQWGQDNVMFACDFGEMPTENRVGVLEALLVANREVHGQWSPVFTMDPKSGRAMSMLALPLEDFDTQQTLVMLASHVAAVERWRKDYFLEPELRPERPDALKAAASRGMPRLATARPAASRT
ncbi:MAG TPA: CesT family type III secretion system chaperone [Albitalea sp.]|uniref:CesT family type III secretion system chaperone n=1 Tax=Piscinibacter sp. TaxID=1903157 RepID=UPI002ECFF148